MSLIKRLSLSHDECEFVQDFPLMVQNHRHIWAGDLKNKQHVQSVKDYVKLLIGVHFYGQSSKDQDTDFADLERESLATVMMEMNSYLRSEHINGYSTPKLSDLVKKISKYRRRCDEVEAECFERLMKDCERFLAIYVKQELTENLTECHYWGTRQQLLAGKVIADWVDYKVGPLDPVFGALLTPTAGRVGPGNSNFLHRLLFDNNGEFAYHSAVHDAFGFLKAFHNVGPGYDYLNWKLLGRINVLAGQISGLCFWWSAISKGVKDKIVFV